MIEERLLTREEIRQRYPEYDSLEFLDRVGLDLSENTCAGKYIREFAPNLEYIMAGVWAIGGYFIQPSYRETKLIICGFFTLAGYLVGYGLRIALGCMVYETFSEEGDYRGFVDSIKSIFSDRT